MARSEHLDFDLGRRIVSSAIRGGAPAIQKYLDQGWDESWLDDTSSGMYLASVVFPRPHDDAWRFILRHIKRHNLAPTEALFRIEFPEATYALFDDDHEPEELIEVAAKKLNATVLMDAINTANSYAYEDPTAAANVLSRALERASYAPDQLPFKLLSLDDIRNLPEIEPLIDGIIDHGTVTMLAGESGKGKSFLALDWAFSVANGRPWQGRRVREGKVLYIAAEGVYGIRKRLAAWESVNGTVNADNMTVIGSAVQLAVAGDLAGLTKVAKNYDLIVIDTLSRTAAGLEENSATDMSQYVDACYKIRDAAEDAGATVLIVHHTGYNATRQRGSSALYANIDGQIMVEAEDPHQFMKVTVSKRKDGPTGDPIAMMLDNVEGSCVLVPCQMPEDEIPLEERIVEAISQAGTGMTQTELSDVLDINKSNVSRKLTVLIGKGRIAKIDGRPARYINIEEN